ncbi:MAG: CDP-alcohol phosphatidyltransferase family protein [Longimicrobiales bacterium]|nr:CDP-alcohol phosphatidyltransferase family protein [Longimicrobiales bacterium]
MNQRKSYRVPNLVIAGRVALAFVAVGLLSLPSLPAAGVAVVLIVVVIAMDGLDGILARKLGVMSDFGAVLDITADRIVEHIFWIYFAVAHQVGVWVPLVIMTRSFVVDTVRGMAFAHGKTAFGGATMMRSSVTRFLTASRFMRNLYGVSKTAAFVLLGLLMAEARANAEGGFVVPPAALGALESLADLAVVVTVALCLARGVPVVLDSRDYLFERPEPASGSGNA